MIGEELWILISFSMLVILSLTVWFFNDTGKDRKTGNWKSLIFFLLIFVVVFIGQIPNFARYAVHINESQHIAEARTLVNAPLFWKDVDGTTIGPIPIYALSVPGHFNIPIDYLTAKVLNVLLWFIIIVLLYKTIKIGSGINIARYSILPLAVFVTLFTNKDFVAYNGEVPTLVLVSLALWILFYLLKHGGKNGLLNILLGAILTLSPFSKIQIGPVAVFIGGFYLIWLIRKKKRVGSIIYLFTGVSVPIILLIVYLIHFDLWYDFKESYILNNLFYAGKGEGLSLNKGIILNFVKLIFVLFKSLELRLFFSGFILLIIYAGFLFWHEKKISEWKNVLYGHPIKIYLIGYILISAFIIYLPGNVFIHYALFLIPPVLLIMSIVLQKIFRNDDSRVRRFFYLIIIVVGPALIIAFQGHPCFMELKHKSTVDKGMANYLCAEKVRGDKLALWGWESSLYSDTGLEMATRESQTQRQILSWKQKDYYLKRYLKDIRKSRPRFFIDSTLKNNWIFDYDKHNFTKFPELNTYISDNYVFVLELDHMKLYELRGKK